MSIQYIYPDAIQPKHKRLHQTLVWTGLLMLCGVFQVAGIAKSLAFDELLDSLHVSRLLSDFFVKPVAVGVIVWEFSVAFGLLYKKTRIIALWAYAATTLVFAGYAIWRYAKGIKVPCNCFGAIFKMSLGASIALCVFLISLTITLLYYYETRAQRAHSTQN